MENLEKTSGVIFVGCMFLGMGLECIFDLKGAAMFIGMGVGYIASAFYEKEKSK